MLDKQLIIDTNLAETRVALLEKGILGSFFIERHRDQGMVGNIYLGEVMRVLPGMQSAFVDIGTSRSSFLFGGDVFDPDLIKNTESDAEIFGDDDLNTVRREVRVPIEKQLRSGQSILVQVAKEALGTKGARVTMYISLPGRYLVIMPYFHHIGVSRRIEDEQERQRLKDIVSGCKPDNIGVIIRTAAKNIPAEPLERDLRYLVDMWKQIERKILQAKTPSLIHQDLDLLARVTRDHYTDDIEKIVINDEEAGNALRDFLEATSPGAGAKVEIYRDRAPIFDTYGIEMDLGRALSAKVDLPSGGYLIIEQTEALTSFDINTGKYVGRGNARETILRTNLEAISKVVDQLRVRNIGGIIVIDFIDMEHQPDREKVYQALQEELKRDKAKTNVLPISDLGLVQMTRKRTSPSLERSLLDKCPCCDGRGLIKSAATQAFECIREIQRRHIQTGERRIQVRTRDDIRDWILSEERALFNQICSRFGIEVEFLPTKLQIVDLHESPFEVL